MADGLDDDSVGVCVPVPDGITDDGDGDSEVEPSVELVRKY